jgi:hypothetical protein
MAPSLSYLPPRRHQLAELPYLSLDLSSLCVSGSCSPILADVVGERAATKTPSFKKHVGLCQYISFMAPMIYGIQLRIIVLKLKLASFDFLAKF